MAQRLDFNQPFQDLRKLIPTALRNPVNQGLLDNLFNRFLTHDEAVPFYGYVGRRPTDAEDQTPRVPQPSPDRDINAVIPVLNFKQGTETYAYTTQDLLNKAKVLGMDTNDLGWLYSQGNNFAPPIDFDKFTNFFNYYWVAKALPTPPVLDWNPELLPEFYVIAPPALIDLDKLNVQTASGPGQSYVLTGSGFLDQTFTLAFTTPIDFTITLSAALQGPLGVYTPVTSTFSLSALPSVPQAIPADVVDTFQFQVTGPAGTFTLLTFTVTRGPTYDVTNVHNGYDGFSAGDVFDIQTSYLSPNYNVVFSGASTTRGKVGGVLALNSYQTIGGLQVTKGDRVLIKNQTNGAENGIYVVSEHGWSRAADYDTATWAVGSKTFVQGGTSANTLWISGPTVFDWSFTGITVSNTNDWQEGNFWVKGDDLTALGLDRADVIQATRPIIEFAAGLQLNSYVDSSNQPSDAGTFFRPEKTEFNELPLFDLFRYDGTHSGLVSGIFYYVEDLTADLDLVLQRRVKLSTNSSADFLFNHGCADLDGELLFFKKGGALQTVWHAGYLGSTVVDYIASADNVGDGTLSAVTAADLTQQQVWTLVATSPTTFELAGSKVPTIPSPDNTATVGVPFQNLDIGFTITAGVTPFAVGDTFTIRVGNLERPRYVFRASDDSIQDLYGGPAADVNGIGTYATNRPFYHNPYNDSRAEITEGSLYTHFRSVLSNQVAGLPTDYAFGGNIKLWSEQHTLLASLLMQRDLTLTSMIDMAQRQYETGLNAIVDLYKQKVFEYFSTQQVVDYDGSPAQKAKATSLLDYLLSFRATDNDVRTVLYDSTAGVVGFPATLPQLGLAELIVPSQQFDLVLGVNVLQHHDGHLSQLFADSLDFRDAFLSPARTITRSDGAVTPVVGSFTNTPPANPYKGEIWLRPTGIDVSDMLAFDVVSDETAAPPLGPVGSFWYQRSSMTLFQSDGFTWVAQPSPLAAWRVINLADTLNELMLLTETRLYDAINPDQRRFDFTPLLSDTEFLNELERELFNFAALNNLDPLGTNYNPADAFTWNYSQALTANFPPLNTVTVPARWYNIVKAHHATVAGVIPTERPDLQPWRLLGYSDYATWWASLAPAQQAAYTPFATSIDGTFIDAGTVRAVQTNFSSTPLTGLPTIDGVTLANGDRVLLQNESAPANNGVWIVSTGFWTRAPFPLTYKTFVTVTEGQTRANSVWALTATVANVNVDPVLFEQVRAWSDQLWVDIQSSRPTLRLSLNPFTDGMLPPYVSSTSPLAVYALTTVIPSGIALPFSFGEGSPVEEVWQRSTDYRYALAKALGRFDPLALLGFAWGFNWVQVDGILYDGFDINVPGHKRFRLHGEAVTSTHTAADLTFSAISATQDIDITVTYDGYDDLRRQSFSVRDTATGTFLGTVTEGATWNFISLSLNINITNIRIEDSGRPFHIGDKFRITATAAGGNIVKTFTPASIYLYLGLGQTFTNALREVAISTTNSYAMTAYRGWDVNMGYRAGGLVATDDLEIFTEQNTLSAASYSLIFKKNEIAKDMWLQGLRVTVLQYGTFAEQVIGAGTYVGQPQTVPAYDGSDWVFRVEGYNPRYTALTYTTFAPIASGVAFPTLAPIGQRFFRHDLGAYYEFDGATWNVIQSSDLVTFNALDQTATSLTWFQPTQVTGTAEVFLPQTITGVQNLVTFLYGYAHYTNEIGWRFNSDNEYNIDQETGRHRNFQLEIEKTVDRIYRGIALGQGHVVNPFMDRVWVQQDTGLLSQFRDTALFDITGDPGVFDVLGVRINSSDIVPLRGNLISSFATRAPMYSAHAQLDEYEHLFIFADWVEASTLSGLLYDAFSGSRNVTYKFNGRMQGTRTMRPEFGGHYLVGHEVRQNLQASTDAIAEAYDANHAFENTTTSKHALALLGFSLKDYFTNLDISEKTQFNFWRGLIHTKGTNSSVGAYLNSNRYRNATIDEYWAYKLAEYGDARQHTYPELRLNVIDSLQQFTQLQFDAPVGEELTNFTQISRLDESRWFSIDDLDQDAYFKAEPIGSYMKTITVVGELLTLPFVADKLIIVGPAVKVNGTTLQTTGTGDLTVVGYGPAVARYNPAKLFNYVDDELISDIPHWHPAAGQHTPTALEAVNIIGPVNPAHYNYSTLVENNNSYDPLRPWGERELGRVWLDTRNLAYVPYYDPVIFPNRAERLSRWGSLADYATIDVYEWVRSSVPPSEYSALAAVEAVDADISDAEKASGEPALQETYVRDRQWSIRPITWSQSGTVNGGHPAFNGSFDFKLNVVTGTLYTIDAGTFGQQGVEVGMSIGGWEYDLPVPRPTSEALITGQTKVFSNNGTAVAATGLPGSTVTISMSSYTEQSGTIVFSTFTEPPAPVLDPTPALVGYNHVVKLRAFDFDSGLMQDVVTETLFEPNTVGPAGPTPNITVTAGQVFTYTFDTLGITVTVTVATSGTFSGEAPAQAIADALTGVVVYDAVIVQPVTAPLSAQVFSNDPADGLIGWAAWNIPTQAQLTADGRQPNSIWKPYVGEYVSFPLTAAQLADAVAYEKALLTLNDGTVIDRYATSWSDWSLLTDTIYTAVPTVTGSVVFPPHFENIDSTRTTVYVNGIAQLAANYTIVGKVLTVTSVAAGSLVYVKIRKYQPTAAELAFNPDVADDLTFQQHYKQDYEYVALPQRDSEGAITSTLYYFWVKSRSVVAKDKKLSTQAIVQYLRDGPDNYLTFQPRPGTTSAEDTMLGTGSASDPYRYDAITISGLSYVVTKDATFKLRFTRNFTLRDDPEELNLKNVHTEWGLIRAGQKSRIPESLWNKLVDSACGEDAAGNPVPALRRTLYDERNGSTTQFGFGPEQTLAPSSLLTASIEYTILNTTLEDTSVEPPVPDFISFLDFSQSDTWFATPASTRQTLTDIWANAKVSQINEIFFAALNDVLASNLELTDIFKTSRLSAYTTKEVVPAISVPVYE